MTLNANRTHADYVAACHAESGLTPSENIAAMPTLTRWSHGTLIGFLDDLAYEARTIVTADERAAIQVQVDRVREALAR